jgi:hypothetical protein
MYNISVVGVNGAGNGTTSKLTYVHTGMIRARLSQQSPVISLLSNTSTILYQVQYNCAGEVPVSVYGVIRRNDDTDDIQYDNQLISVSNNSNIFNGSYTIDGLIHNSYYKGHLVFTSMSGSTSNSESFEIWTFDVDTVNISVNTSNGLCVRVTYTNGSDAIGYNMRIINRHIADETTSLNVTKYVNEYCQSLSGGHYTIQVYDWESNNTISFNWRYEYNITIDHIVQTPPILSSSSSSFWNNIPTSIVLMSTDSSVILITPSTAVNDPNNDGISSSADHQLPTVTIITAGVAFIMMLMVVSLVILAIMMSVWVVKTKHRNASYQLTHDQLMIQQRNANLILQCTTTLSPPPTPPSPMITAIHVIEPTYANDKPILLPIQTCPAYETVSIRNNNHY